MDRPAAIFDMDGTLVDSMPYWMRLTDEYLEQLHLPESIRDDLKAQVMTMSLSESAALFCDALELDCPPEEIVLAMGDLMDHHYQTDIPLRPGVREFLEKLRGDGVAMCVVTLTPTPLAQTCLERLGVAEYFEFILSSDDAHVGKDKPDIFRIAAMELDVHPGEAAVFEDSLYAARAARQAGCWVVGIFEETSAHNWPKMQRLCDVTIESWEEALEYL
jgi:HAD superfamily hydrolase (TIGR01509 family)